MSHHHCLRRLCLCVHPDVCSDARSCDAFKAVAEAYRTFEPTFDPRALPAFDPRQAECQGDALTTSAWMYDEADNARRRHRVRCTLR